MKYIIKTDGHNPTLTEIETGKRQFRRIRQNAHPNDEIKTAKSVVMVFTDSNYCHSWSFQGF